MPIVEITGLPQPPATVDRLLAAVCADVAAVLGEDARGTWATWRTIERYAEGADLVFGQPPATHPPLARVIAFEGRRPELVRRVLAAVAGAVRRELGLEAGNVFVRYDEVTAGRLHTGGRVVDAGPE